MTIEFPNADESNDTANDHPFARLTPDCVINAVESVGLISDGRLLALNSYENRVYQVGIEESSPVVVKIYRPERWSDEAILEEHDFMRELLDADLPVVPPIAFDDGLTLHRYSDFRFAVFPRQGGRVPEVYGTATLERMGRLVARLHAVGVLRPFQHRPSLSVEHFGTESMRFLLKHGAIPMDQQSSYQRVAEEALAVVQACFARAGTVCQLRLHGDCYAGNVLWTDDGPHLVDFDDSRSGAAIQDLWMFLSGDMPDRRRQLRDLLTGYDCFREFDPRELYLIEALRTLRIMHYAAWLARRWDDPAFPPAFPWFNTPSYWSGHIRDLQEQITVMAEEALWSD